MEDKILFVVRPFVCLIAAGWIGNLFAAELNEPTNQPVAGPAFWSPTAVSYICNSNMTEPTYQGLPISQWIQTKTLLNTNRLTLSELLTLKQVSAADEWGIVNFELPINFDMLGELHLGVINNDGDFVECCFEDCERATNSHCLLSWNINYDPPGKHSIRAKLVCYNHFDPITVIGPPLTFYSSNVCQFFESGSMFDSKGAYLDAKLREQVATYRIELKTAKGKHIKTITGSTTNGMIESDWDLTDERGKKFKDDSFDGFFHVAYPDDIQTNAPTRKNFNRLGGG